jgi:hypothetical protein
LIQHALDQLDMVELAGIESSLETPHKSKTFKNFYVLMFPMLFPRMPRFKAGLGWNT